MRSFINFDNVSVVHPDIQLTVTANDSSQVFTFDRNAINFMSDVKWEMPFFGGIAKSLNYDIELLLGLDNIKNILRFLPGGVSELKITINSNDFYPHIGRVRGIQRDTPDTVKLTIFDRFFDSKLFFPKELITDSFATPHLEELLSGYPVYYGKHTRPFYHTAIDSNVDRLIGPRNISSENHVNSVWFNSAKEQGRDLNLDHNILLNKDWQQQSGDTNFIDGGFPFEVKDISVLDVRLWEFTGNRLSVFNHTASVRYFDEGFVQVDSPRLLAGRQYSIELRPSLSQFKRVSELDFSLTIPTNSIGTAPVAETNILVSSGLAHVITIVNTAVLIGGPETWNHSFIFNPLSDNFGNTSESLVGFENLFSSLGANNGFTVFHGDLTNASITCSLRFSAELLAEAYAEFSIFSPIVKSSDIAISQNPFAIIDDIASNHLSIEYLQNQSSDSQVDVQSFNFQCLFKKRVNITDIFDQFGRITDVNMWIGDSGILNFRTFKESGNEVVNNSLDLSNIETIILTEAPIGSSVFEQDLSSKIKIKYNFDFQKNEFQNTKVADRNNTPECNSLDARDITNEIERETEYILEKDTASYYLGNLVRKFARGSEFINITGGVDLFPMELGDVFHLQHPMLIDSSANYQIIKLNANYLSGKISITAGKLD